MKRVKKKQKLHNPDSPLLIGDIKKGEVVKEINEPHILIHKLSYSNNCIDELIFF